jgi:type IV secretion system protein VirD4
VSSQDDTFPPRGSGKKRPEAAPAVIWGHPSQLGRGFNWSPGKVVLGHWDNRLIGDPDRIDHPGEGDDRHIVTIAGSRAGKSSTVLEPNLRRYTGSMIVLDPKGDLARNTAAFRQKELKQRVVILDPFKTSGFKTHAYDPLGELDPTRDTFFDDILLISDALIVDDDVNDPFWTDAAKNLLRALILYVFAAPGERSLGRVRRVLLGAEGKLGRPQSEDESADDFLFLKMAMMEHFEGRLALLGRSFAEKYEKEIASIISVAREHLAFLDSNPMQEVLRPDPFRIGSIKSAPTTVYVCLPAGRLATHFRWMRLLITVALIELERDPTKPPVPVLLMLEEFAALQRMRGIERAAGFFAGFGVRLWTVLQDLSQLKAHYPKAWETFFANAGVVQAFGNMDITTTKYLSDAMGKTEILQRQKVWASANALDTGDPQTRESHRSVNLLDPSEITALFSRETNRQLLLIPGRPPIHLERLRHGE